MNAARFLLALTASLTLLGCGAAQTPDTTTVSGDPVVIPPPLGDVPEIRPGIMQGYLGKNDFPDSVALLPPPPKDGSAKQAYDDVVSKAHLNLQDSPNWKLAARDAHLSFPLAATHFSCAMGIPIDEAQTPQLYRLLRRTLADIGLSTYGAKDKYQRPRPFVSNGQPICSPEERDELSHDGSYPSGHTAIGWGWALILAELNPDSADAILARGMEYGRSRIICNVHWNSDVEAGRVIAAAAVSKLHSNSDFMAAMSAAAVEIQAMKKLNAAPNGDCELEQRARANSPDDRH